jgi:peptide/nickel transport system substrate-binding protein
MLRRNRPAVFCAIAVLTLIASSALTTTSRQVKPLRDEAKFGGRIIISRSAAPRTFNRLFSFDDQTSTITDSLMGHLIRVNRHTQLVEPELARSWKFSRDGKSVTFTLRDGVKFSDGRAFSADDVVFTFQVINDPKVVSPVAGQFNFDGRRVEVRKQDDRTVVFDFPVAYASAIRLFDGIPILPRHALEQSYREGKVAQAWAPSTRPDQVVGLGPFRLKSYTPNQRVVVTRNENYWKTDAAERKLPYLDEIVFEIVPDRNTQLLKFQNGETDLLSPVNADDAPSLMPLDQQGKIKLVNLGPGTVREIFWFNLNDGKNAATGQPLVDPVKLRWFRDKKFRQAVSHAIDRQAIVNLAFAGKASPQWEFLSPADKLWFNRNVRKYPRDLVRAKSLLADAGFRFVPETRVLLDSQDRPVSFTLMTNAGNVIRQKIIALIQEDLAGIGIKVNLAQIESRALLSRINEGFNYEACLLAIVSGDSDPSSHTNIIFSSGSNHWWHPRQTRPATDWESRLDDLMTRQMTALNPRARKQLFDEVQSIMAEQQPFIFLASRHLIVAAKTDIGNLKPAVLPDFVLWNCDELYRK